MILCIHRHLFKRARPRGSIQSNQNKARARGAGEQEGEGGVVRRRSTPPRFRERGALRFLPPYLGLLRYTYPADGLSRSSVTGRFLSSGETSSPSCSRSSRPSCSSCPSCPSCCSCSCSYSCCYSRVETMPAVAPCSPCSASS